MKPDNSPLLLVTVNLFHTWNTNPTKVMPFNSATCLAPNPIKES